MICLRPANKRILASNTLWELEVWTQQRESQNRTEMEVDTSSWNEEPEEDNAP